MILNLAYVYMYIHIYTYVKDIRRSTSPIAILIQAANWAPRGRRGRRGGRRGRSGSRGEQDDDDDDAVFPVMRGSFAVVSTSFTLFALTGM